MLKYLKNLLVSNNVFIIVSNYIELIILSTFITLFLGVCIIWYAMALYRTRKIKSITDMDVKKIKNTKI